MTYPKVIKPNIPKTIENDFKSPTLEDIYKYQYRGHKLQSEAFYNAYKRCLKKLVGFLSVLNKYRR